MIGPPNIASSPTVPPIAIAAASPTARVSVATAMITNIRKKVSSTSHRNAWPCEPDGQGGADVGDVPERAAQEQRRREGAGELRRPVGDDARPREVARERERERHSRVEVRAGDVADGVDHDHDHEAEADRDADVAERARLRVDHDRARSRRRRARRCRSARPPATRSVAVASAAARAASAAGRPAVPSLRASSVFTALTIAPCMPSATSWVNSTETCSKPAASRPGLVLALGERAGDAADIGAPLGALVGLR